MVNKLLNGNINKNNLQEAYVHMSEGEVVSTTAFVLENKYKSDYKGVYIRLVDGMSAQVKSQIFKEAIV